MFHFSWYYIDDFEIHWSASCMLSLSGIDKIKGQKDHITYGYLVTASAILAASHPKKVNVWTNLAVKNGQRSPATKVRIAMSFISKKKLKRN